MTSLGASAPLDYVIESVLNPGAKVKEGFNAVSFTLKDNTVVTGIQARETANEVHVRDAAGNEQAVVKANIVSKTDIGSIMPAGLVEQLPERERWDLFAFLGELGKPGGFDASKGKVARLWMLGTEPPQASATPADATTNPSAAPQVLTLVDGNLPKDLLAEAVQPLATAERLYATARFQSSGQTQLRISGAHKVWVNGEPLTSPAEAKLELAAGEHHLTVELNPKELPTVLRAESAEARFLGN
jgi:putative heme-binding domain-containing protein